jgi:hypothetical protein
MATFVDRGCHVVSVTDPCGRIIGFLDRAAEKLRRLERTEASEAEENMRPAYEERKPHSRRRIRKFIKKGCQ